jgi:hypothetical protein
MMEEQKLFYVVTSQDVVDYHERSAKALEKEAELLQGKLEQVPAGARDMCQQGRLQHLAAEAEKHRKLLKAVRTNETFVVDAWTYLKVNETDSFNWVDVTQGLDRGPPSGSSGIEL